MSSELAQFPFVAIIFHVAHIPHRAIAPSKSTPQGSQPVYVFRAYQLLIRAECFFASNSLFETTCLVACTLTRAEDVYMM